jgi:subtilisin family serine protease
LAVAHVTPTYVYGSALNGFAASLNAGQLNALKHHNAVQAIEPDTEVRPSLYLTEAMLSSGQPWGWIGSISAAVGPAPTTGWSSGLYGAGKGIRAYVIDTGIATADSDFGGRASDVYDALGGNGQDGNGHGTHVAGTIGGNRYGVAKSALLRGVRVLDCTGHGQTSAIIAGINWVRAHAIKPAVANISTGGGYSTDENTAVTNLVNSGVFVAVAAGNGNTNACSTSHSNPGIPRPRLE